MEQTSGSGNRKGKGGIPLWLFAVLCVVLFLTALMLSLFVLQKLDVIHCGSKSAPTAQTATGQTAVPAQQGTEQQQTYTDPENPETSQNPENPQDPEYPENPEYPEDPENPEYPEDPEDPESPEDPENPEDPEEQPSTPEPIVVSPTEVPTPEPTEAPTPEPTEAPKAATTEKPDYFMFGGKKIKCGEKKINGKSLGINGKSKKPRHIPKEEVQDLVTLCPDLEELVLEYCSLEDYTPIGQLTKLRKLAFTYCGTGDGNAITDISWLESLTNLRWMNLSHNKIDDTEAVSGLTKLTYLNLAGNPLTDEDLKPLSSLTNLETLYLYDLKKITDVTPLSKLSKLKFLHVGHNSKLKNVKPLTKLKKLTQLRLNHTKVSDLSYFKNFSALTKLDVGKCPIPKEQFYNLKGCKKLTKIVLEMSDADAFYAIVDMIGDGYPFHVQYQWKDE